MSRRVWYLALEPYYERYTERLWDWTYSRWKAAGLNVVLVTGGTIKLAAEGGLELVPHHLSGGQVLSPRERARWAMAQIGYLLDHWDEVSDNDIIYLDDMFHPGYEALPYVMHQTGKRPKIITRCWAQSYDVYDFTHAMIGWMRRYEEMVEATAYSVLIESQVHLEHLRGAGYTGRIDNFGHPFDMHDVRRLGEGQPSLPGKYVVFSSRMDDEKQPLFMLEVATELAKLKIRTVICTGAKQLRMSSEVRRHVMNAMDCDGLEVHAGLTKAQYYGILSGAVAQLNTSLQDYVSYTALEASALGVPTVAPAFRSFIELFEYDPRFTYRPWVVGDVVDRVLQAEHLFLGRESMIETPALHHHGSLDRIADWMKRL